ncbi:hypothetical protein J437_LFUL000824 [Ladona fulva]|uniref:Uncharacterized protein n=1 Tax=Ladona fulva TaxID=123851 RepID=A0A8K0PEJ9_LADFU|nr:hypothetical protein J437_LFUL000824 [Ladona fulva]
MPFSLDGTRLSFNLLPRIALMSDISKIFLFGTMLIVCVVPLSIIKLMHKLVKGPWSIGEVIEKHTGVIFAWGTIIRGAYLPGSFTYAYGFFQMLSYQLPLTLFLAHCVDNRFYYFRAKRSHLKRFCFHFPFVVIVSLQVMFAYFFWLAYGTMAFLLGPLRTWSIALGIVLWQYAINLPEKCLRNAATVWAKRHTKCVNECCEEDVPMDTMVYTCLNPVILITLERSKLLNDQRYMCTCDQYNMKPQKTLEFKSLWNMWSVRKANCTGEVFLLLFDLDIVVSKQIDIQLTCTYFSKQNYFLFYNSNYKSTVAKYIVMNFISYQRNDCTSSQVVDAIVNVISSTLYGINGKYFVINIAKQLFLCYKSNCTNVLYQNVNKHCCFNAEIMSYEAFIIVAVFIFIENLSVC